MEPQTIDLGNGHTKQVRYREDGPAHISYYYSGSIEDERYYINGISHREDGPAVTWYFKSGEIGGEFYCLHSKRLTKYEFEQRMVVKKFDLI